MSAPRLEIDLRKLGHNARTLVDRLAARGISVTGVTKGTLGLPEVAFELLRSGVTGLGDARIESIERMRAAGVPGPMTLIRSPMLSQVHRVVAGSDVSFNTELSVLAGLSAAARDLGVTHGVVLMVELGDRREGVMPVDLADVVRETLALPNLTFHGIGTNLACQHGVAPDADNMAELSALATSIEATFGFVVDVVSGGNSANLDWALSGASTGLVNDLRLGESILLGREALHRRPLDGLHTDAITLVAEVIEAKVKPSRPHGTLAQTAFGEVRSTEDRGDIAQAILAIGHQDVDPSGIVAPPGMEVLGASSDHLVVDPGRHRLLVGAEVAFQLNYSSLLRAMTSLFVAKVVKNGPAPSLDPSEVALSARVPVSGPSARLRGLSPLS